MTPPPKAPITPVSAPTALQDSVPVGPSTGIFSIQSLFISERQLRQTLRRIGYDEAREDTYRIKGVQLIDKVRESLHLYATYVRRPTTEHG